MRELVKGSTISIECLNNLSKKYVHIPQCSSHKSAMTQARNLRFIHEIVDTLGAGAEKVADSFNKGALWLCGGLADIFRDEFVQAAARAGVTCISRMSAEATAAMWTDAKLTKANGKYRDIYCIGSRSPSQPRSQMQTPLGPDHRSSETMPLSN
jgi:hypothetical protein